MRDLISQPIVYLLIEDEAALFTIDGTYVYQIAGEQVKKSEFKPKIKVFCVQEIYKKFKDTFTQDFELIIDSSLSNFIKKLVLDNQIIIFHNAARPLVPTRIYDQGIKMLLQGWDAVKQKHVVVDTLKRINEQNFVVETVNRDLVKAVTFPEFYWTDNISGTSNEISWLYSILDETNKDYIYGEIESTRIRTKQDLFLIDALMKQKGLT